jgi:hypothetical protein
MFFQSLNPILNLTPLRNQTLGCGFKKKPSETKRVSSAQFTNRAPNPIPAWFQNWDPNLVPIPTWFQSPAPYAVPIPAQFWKLGPILGGFWELLGTQNQPFLPGECRTHPILVCMYLSTSHQVPHQLSSVHSTHLH